MARVVFFGNERLSTGFKTGNPTLKALLAAGHEVVAVITNFNPIQGKSRNNRDLEVEAVAQQNNIPLLMPLKLEEIREDIKALKADLGVLVAYGQIVPESVINIFPKGIINIHPSLLPLHRGPTPVESVILSGEKTTGVSIMKLVKAMDAGPVYGQTIIELKGNETKLELTEQLLKLGAEKLVELLPGIMNESLEAKYQDDSQATYDTLIKKEDGLIDWNKSAELLEREIRAYAEWPKSYTELKGIAIVITKAHSVPTKDGTPGYIDIMDSKNMTIACGQGSLCIEMLKPAGKKEMAINAFIAGYGSRL